MMEHQPQKLPEEISKFYHLSTLVSSHFTRFTDFSFLSLKAQHSMVFCNMQPISFCEMRKKIRIIFELVVLIFFIFTQ